MKTSLKNTNGQAIYSSNLKTSEIGMDAKGAKMAMLHMRDTIYTNKLKAPVREYIANCVDEHKKHNITKPFEVKILENGTVSFRDFALGLCEDDVRSVFASYFSTKKDGDNNGIGGFGVGAMAFFALEKSGLDAYYVDSYHNGVLSKYAITSTMGDDGLPTAIILKVSEEPTTETGLCVHTNIKHFDQSQYVLTEMYDYAKTFLYTLDDCEMVLHTPHGEVLHSVKPNHVHKGEFATYKFFKNIHTAELSAARFGTMPLNITIGGVFYNQHSQHSITNIFASDNQHQLTVVCEVNIGNLGFNIGRETINNDHSSNAYIDSIGTELLTYCQSVKNTPIVTGEYTDIFDLYNNRPNNYLHLDVVYKKCEHTNKKLLFCSESMVPNNHFEHTNYIHILKCVSDTIVRGMKLEGTQAKIDAPRDQFKNHKTQIYVLPNIKNNKTWISRVEKFLNKPTSDIIFVREDELHNIQDTQELKNHYKKFGITDVSLFENVELVRVKQMGLSAAKSSDEKKYAINKTSFTYSYVSNNYKQRTIDEFVEFVDTKIDETTDVVEKFYQKVIVPNKQSKIITTPHQSHNERHELIESGAIKHVWSLAPSMTKKLIDEHGFILFGSREFKEKIKPLVEQGKKQKKISKNKMELDSSVMFTPSDRIMNILLTNKDKCDEYIRKYYAIVSKHATASKIHTLYTNTHSRAKSRLTRSDFRGIISL